MGGVLKRRDADGHRRVYGEILCQRTPFHSSPRDDFIIDVPELFLRMRSFPLLLAAALICFVSVSARAQNYSAMPETHHMHQQSQTPAVPSTEGVLSSHQHDTGPPGETYDLRFIDDMIQHHRGALRMSEFVFDIGSSGVGALAKEVWIAQSQEIKAMQQWRKAWYPEAPIYPIVYKAGGDPNSMSGLTPISTEQIAAMQMLNSKPARQTRVTWFLEGMITHHGAALLMARDALKNSTNVTIRRLARNIILAQRAEILQIRRMLQHDGLNKPAYYNYDSLFSL